MSEIDSLSSQKRRASLIAKYGSLEAYQAEAKRWGKSGGLKSKGGAFNKDPELASRAGKLGYQARVKKLKNDLLQEIKEGQHDSI